MVTDDDRALLRRYANLATFSASSLNEPQLNARGGEALRRLLDEHAELSGRLGAAAWVPCAERMPEQRVEVLAVSPGAPTPFVAAWNGFCWYVESDREGTAALEHADDVPMHWMPMPAPPME